MASQTVEVGPVNYGQRLVFEERIHLERIRASVLKEQADLRLERANWERDRYKAERDEFEARAVRLQGMLDKERRTRRNAFFKE